jgi:hypothetical protein
VSDAQHALKAAARQSPPKQRTAGAEVFLTAVPAKVPVVTAVCQASSSGELFLGFQSGEVFCFRPKTRELLTLPHPQQVAPIRSVAVTDTANMVVVLRSDDKPPYSHLTSLLWRYDRYGVMGTSWSNQEDGYSWLGPVAILAPDLQVLSGDNDTLRLLGGLDLLPLRTRSLVGRIKTVLFCGMSTTVGIGDTALLLFDDMVNGIGALHEGPIHGPFPLGWRLSSPSSCSLQPPPLSWFRKNAENLELAGLDEEGHACWSNLEFEKGALVRTTPHLTTERGGYRGVTLIVAGLLAAVGERTVDLLRCGRKRLQVIQSRDVGPTRAIACFRGAGDVLVVASDGTVLRIPL